MSQTTRGDGDMCFFLRRGKNQTEKGGVTCLSSVQDWCSFLVLQMQEWFEQHPLSTSWNKSPCLSPYELLALTSVQER